MRPVGDCLWVSVVALRLLVDWKKERPVCKKTLVTNPQGFCPGKKVDRDELTKVNVEIMVHNVEEEESLQRISQNVSLFT